MSKIGVLALILLSVGCATNDAAIKNEKASYHLQLGTSYLLKGAHPQALKELLEAEKLNPNEPVIQNNLGLAYLVREKIDEAETRFKKAITLNPKYTDARNNIGRLYMNAGLYKKAISELEIAAADLTYEQPEKSWANLGQAYFLDMQYAKAKTALQKSLKDRKDSCYTMNYYGRTLFELGSFKPAAESLDQAVQLCLQANFDEPYFYGGMSYYKAGDHAQAKARFKELMQFFPESKYSKAAKELLELIQ
jgi:type IV pilus assembly protein PilF